MIWKQAESYVGQKYDFRSITGFIPGLRWLWRDHTHKIFCSHVVAKACKTSTFGLFSPQTPLYKISPGLIDYSPSITLLGEVHNMTEFTQLINKYI